MKDYSKVGGRKGKPAYRTPSSFQTKKFKQIGKVLIDDPNNRPVKKRPLFNPKTRPKRNSQPSMAWSLSVKRNAFTED